MLCACIDIGSNTTRVLVAEVGADGGLTAVLQRRAFTRIGAGLEPGGAISAAKLEEVAAVVAEQAALAARAGARRVRSVATAAIRGAANGDEFCAVISARSGVQVEILDGETEARLAFAGATWTLGGSAEGVVGVVDVGGGSTEIAVGTVAGGVTWSASCPIGSGLLADAHLKSDPPTAPELEAVGRHAHGALAHLEPPLPDCAVAVGGSATSLGRLVGPVLAPEALRKAIEVLSTSACADVARRLDLEPERVRLLPAGILVLDAAARKLAQPLQIGRGGLREGVCLELAG